MSTPVLAQLVLKITDKEPIRGFTTQGKGQQFSVHDFIWNVSIHTNKQSVTKAWSRLIAQGSGFRDEILAQTTYIQFPGRGQRPTPCMDIRGLQHLLSVLGGSVGEAYRHLAETTLTRVAAGDLSMIQEIEENHMSQEPINTMAREALKGCLPEPVELAAVGDMAQDIKKFGALVPVMQSLQQSLEHERSMRLKMQGLYGSEVREANMMVREQAQFWKDQLKIKQDELDEEKKRAAADRQSMLEAHQCVMQMASKILNQ